ncbi:hypothetical protein B8W74_05405 [Arthrobacter agilis]|nr:hypothetical protein B8W74_05405 [Arthrobacter agilis]
MTPPATITQWSDGSEAASASALPSVRPVGSAGEGSVDGTADRAASAEGLAGMIRTVSTGDGAP